MYLNKVFIIGNLTKDPELKAMPSGTKVANFSLATNHFYKDKDGNKKESTDFHNIVVFARMGELAAQYLKKGSQALVEGRIQTRSWDAPDGSKKYRTEIIADNVQFGSRPGASGSSAGASSGKSADGAKDGTKEVPGEAIEYPQEDINPDDIPF
ncbi:MAG: single-stranded DNA-binding protein [Candidatus Taylorbacteria bacterium]|nr:single-stranded DNA-binding protein [Candidatus Taylorbacteria bacterium]